VEERGLTCQYCHCPLTLRAPRFCPVCLYDSDMEEHAAHVAHALLTDAQAQFPMEAERLAQVLQGWLVFQQEVGQIAVDHAPPAAALDQRVKPEANSQRKWREAVQRYKDTVPLETVPAAEFCLVFSIVAEMRAHYLQRLKTPQPTLKLIADTWSFEWYNRIFVAGLCFPDPPAPQLDLYQAVKAMRAEVFDGLAWQLGAMQEHSLEKVREWGTILFSGFMCSMITLSIPRLWNTLARDGEPHQVLRERLPVNVYAARHNGSWSCLEELRNRIVELVIEDGASASLSSHLSPQSLRKAQQELAHWDTIASPL